MPLIFLNGGGPSYSGYVFTTASDLIDTLESTLVSADWTSLAKVAATSLFVRGVTENNHNCWVEFNVSGTAPNNVLYVRGWQQEAKTTGSPANTLSIPFTEGAENRLWIAADQDSGVVCSYANYQGTTRAVHFGFLDRYDPTDQWAWMVGYPHVLGYQSAYAAKSKHNNTNWRLLSADFNSYGNITTANGDYTMPLTTFDWITRGKPYYEYYSRNDALNAFINAFNGRRNYDNKALIDRYCYFEGRGAVNAYSSTTTLYFRGFVKNAYCGVASEAAASQCVDTQTGYRILSCGGSQWQGMRIL